MHAMNEEYENDTMRLIAKVVIVLCLLSIAVNFAKVVV